MKIPRILLAAGASGSGKTLITCGLLQALVDRGLKTASFKCGPDYIDPMFHSRVIGTKSRNLDTFFTSSEITRYLLARNACGCRIAVMEGVMGYYDGVGGTTSRGQRLRSCPRYRYAGDPDRQQQGDERFAGRICKRFSGIQKRQQDPGRDPEPDVPHALHPRMKDLLEKETGIPVLGYVPKTEDCVIESRHLGLVLPDEIPKLKDNLRKLAEILEKTLDIDGIIRLADSAPGLDVETEDPVKAYSGSGGCENRSFSECFRLEKPVRIGVARDESFCFFYEDNFRLLREMGAELDIFLPHA